MTRYLCAWCGALIREDPGEHPGETQISHGLCPICEAKTDDERDKMAEDKAQLRQEKKKNDKPTL